MLSASATNSCLYPVYVRAEAYLREQQGPTAAAEFQKILDHRGLLWNCATAALVHLQLGRAYALQGDSAKARAAYQGFSHALERCGRRHPNPDTGQGGIREAEVMAFFSKPPRRALLSQVRQPRIQNCQVAGLH